MYTDPCTIALRFDQLMWEEIQDMPGEIFDIPDDIVEIQESEEKKPVDEVA